ncbi:MAG: DUF2220 family protein [Sutterellaceae bacterium]|nr:DUF2220 family protein [Sutterellaceae bacterium]
MPLKTPETIDAQLTRSFALKATEWLLAQAFGLVRTSSSECDSNDDPTLPERGMATPENCRVTLSLGRLTQKEAAGNLIAVRNLCRSWQNTLAKRPGWMLTTKPVRWSTLGLTIEIPVKLTIDGPDALCAALAPSDVTEPEWKTAVKRLREVAEFFDIVPTLENTEMLFNLTRLMKNSKVSWSKDYSQDDFKRLLDLVDWLIEHPDSGAFVREIPLEGIDTKWLERHQKEVCGLFNLVRKHRFGIEPCLTENFIQTAGLRVKPLFIRVRHAQHWRPGNTNAAIQLTLDELKETAPASDSVVIIENEQTGLSLNIDANIPILIGMGFGVAVLSQVKWLADKRIVYFGDLDTYGLAIVSELRNVHAQTQSVLMDLPTFQAYRRLAVIEPKQVGKCPTQLCEGERRLFAELSETGLRLEQERIPIDVVNRAIAAAV